MRDYAVVRPEFWTGKISRALRRERPEVRVVSMYVFTAPGSSMIGLYYLPLATMVNDTGLSIDQVRVSLSVLARLGFAFYDEDEEQVWVPGMAEHQVGAQLKPGDKRIAGILKQLRQVAACKFAPQFVERYGTVYGLPPSPLQAPCKPLASIADAPSTSLGRDYDPDPDPVHAPDPAARSQGVGTPERVDAHRAPVAVAVAVADRVDCERALQILALEAGPRLALGRERGAAETRMLVRGADDWKNAWHAEADKYGEADLHRLAAGLRDGWIWDGIPKITLGTLTKQLPNLLALAVDGDEDGGTSSAAGDEADLRPVSEVMTPEVYLRKQRELAESARKALAESETSPRPLRDPNAPRYGSGK